MATQLLEDLDFVVDYIDDIFIHLKLMTEHTIRTAVLCERIGWDGLILRIRKCLFARKDVEFL